MKSVFKLSLLCCLGMLGSQLCHAETPTQQALSQAVIEDNINPIWLTQKWDEKVNKPYATKVAEIEKLLQKNLPPATLLKKYEPAARKNPTSSLAIFPWAYTRYRLVESERIKKPLSQTCEDLYRVLVVAPSPPSAEYARLRYKIEAHSHLASRLTEIGPRLVARYKNDQKLFLVYNGILADSGDLEAAVRNDYILVKKNPKELGHRFNLGSDLTILAWKKRDPKLLDAGETQIDMFEKLAPPNHRLRRYLPNAREYIRLKRLRFAGKTP